MNPEAILKAHRERAVKEMPSKDRIDAAAARIQARIEKEGFDSREPKNQERIARYMAIVGLGAAHRGLYLVGGTGTGKTLAMAFVAQMVAKHWALPKMMSATALVQACNDNGVAAVVREYGDDFAWGDRMKDLFIDDLGTESNAVHMGVRSEAIGELIMLRYDMWKAHGARTHFTSNLTMDEVKNRYGIRVESRISEMCYIQPFGGADRRKDQRQEGK